MFFIRDMYKPFMLLCFDNCLVPVVLFSESTGYGVLVLVVLVPDVPVQVFSDLSIIILVLVDSCQLYQPFIFSDVGHDDRIAGYVYI